MRKMNNGLTATAEIWIKAPINIVWDALTRPDLIKKYFFGTDAISDWKEGSPIVFRGEWEGKTYEDKGTILETEPPAHFRYNYWSSMSGIEDKPENYLIISYDLEEENGETHLTIRQDNIPDEKTKEHSVQNWNRVIADLKNLVENGVAAYE